MAKSKWPMSRFYTTIFGIIEILLFLSSVISGIAIGAKEAGAGGGFLGFLLGLVGGFFLCILTFAPLNVLFTIKEETSTLYEVVTELSDYVMKQNINVTNDGKSPENNTASQNQTGKSSENNKVLQNQSGKIDQSLFVKIPNKNYSVMTTEVTQKQYESIMGENPSYHKGYNLPVEKVSWYDAIYFCNKLSLSENLEPVYSVNGETDVTTWNYTPHKGNSINGEITQNTSATGYRLPTLEEWQYAAKGGENYKYAGSDNLDEVGWYTKNSNDETQPVAQKMPNGYGLYDMSGNVWEWVWDSYGSGYRYGCGGSYGSSADGCEEDYKYNYDADFCGNYIGFRLVCASSEQE
jgi:formylglycine-generating enzyme